MMKATLTGTEKQIVWAESIRSKVIESLNAYFESDETTYGARQEDAYSVMLWMYHGVTRYQAPMGIPTSYEKKVYLETREANKGASATEIDEICGQFTSDIYDEAKKAYRELKEVDKAAAKIAKMRVYKKYAKMFFEYSIENETSAAAWIEAFKGTKFAR